jgi:hypothetical protein
MYILNLLLILCCILFFNFASNFADFVLYYSHAFHSPACCRDGNPPLKMAIDENKSDVVALLRSVGASQ